MTPQEIEENEELNAEIERLRQLADYWHRMHDALQEEKEWMSAQLRARINGNAEIERLRQLAEEKEWMIAQLRARINGKPEER